MQSSRPTGLSCNKHPAQLGHEGDAVALADHHVARLYQEAHRRTGFARRAAESCTARVGFWRSRVATSVLVRAARDSTLVATAPRSAGTCRRGKHRQKWQPALAI